VFIRLFIDIPEIMNGGFDKYLKKPGVIRHVLWTIKERPGGTITREQEIFLLFSYLRTDLARS
jgi:hypothetical protein